MPVDQVSDTCSSAERECFLQAQHAVKNGGYGTEVPAHEDDAVAAGAENCVEGLLNVRFLLHSPREINLLLWSSIQS